MCKAIDIANAFLEKVPKETAKSGDGMNKVSIQKLLFFAQERHLFIHNEPLFDENIYAWEHGPVIKDVWRYYNEVEQTHNISYHPTKKSLAKFTDKQLDTISHIWNKYGDKNAWYLESLSHSYKIWKEQKQEQGLIPIENILEYRRKIEKSKKKARESVEESAKELGLI